MTRVSDHVEKWIHFEREKQKRRIAIMVTELQQQGFMFTMFAEPEGWRIRVKRQHFSYECVRQDHWDGLAQAVQAVQAVAN